MKKTLLALFAFATLISSMSLKAEEKTESPVSVSVGADLVSMYIWRANNYGNSPAIQPYITFAGYGAELTFWGSQAFVKNNLESNPFDEIDMVAKYTFNLGFGSLALTFTDFYYPHLGNSFFNYKDYDSPNPGGHYINTGFEFNGPETFPIKITSDVAIHNDFNKPVYLEFAYKFTSGDMTITPFIGFVKEVGPASLFSTDPTLHTYFLDLKGEYEIDKDRIAFVNAGFAVKKAIKITNDFSLPIEGQLSFNPYTEKAYFAFKLSL